MGKRSCTSHFLFWPMQSVSSIKDQFKLLKSSLAGGQRLDIVMFCLKPFDFIDFNLTLTKYLMFPNSHLFVKI